MKTIYKDLKFDEDKKLLVMSSNETITRLNLTQQLIAYLIEILAQKK